MLDAAVKEDRGHRLPQMQLAQKSRRVQSEVADSKSPEGRDDDLQQEHDCERNEQRSHCGVQWFGEGKANVGAP